MSEPITDLDDTDVEQDTGTEPSLPDDGASEPLDDDDYDEED